MFFIGLIIRIDLNVYTLDFDLSQNVEMNNLLKNQGLTWHQLLELDPPRMEYYCCP